MLDGITDGKKKGFLKSRINDFKKNIDSTKEPIIQGIYIVGESIKFYKLEKYYLETLKMYKVPKFTYKFGKNFEIDWLKNLVLDRSFTFVVKVKNNDISITKFNKTKQICSYNETIKSMNLIDIISKNIKDIKFMVYGASVALKQLDDYKNKLCIGVVNKELSFEEISDFIDDANYRENIKELQGWLSKLLDPKEGNKIVFGNDVLEQAEMGMLETIFCTIENKEKYSKFENIKIKILKSSKNDEIISDFKLKFDSVLGIKYY